MANKTFIVKIKRQPGPQSAPYWEEFEFNWRRGMNITSCFMDIAANPVTREGKPTTPIAYDSNCLEEVCGSGAPRGDGRARMGLAGLGEPLERPIRREALRQFSWGA